MGEKSLAPPWQRPGKSRMGERPFLLVQFPFPPPLVCCAASPLMGVVLRFRSYTRRLLTIATWRRLRQSSTMRHTISAQRCSVKKTAINVWRCLVAMPPMSKCQRNGKGRTARFCMRPPATAAQALPATLLIRAPTLKQRIR